MSKNKKLFDYFLRNISEIQTLIVILWAFEKHLHLSYLNITVLQFRGGEKSKAKIFVVIAYRPPDSNNGKKAQVKDFVLFVFAQ